MIIDRETKMKMIDVYVRGEALFIGNLEVNLNLWMNIVLYFNL